MKTCITCKTPKEASLDNFAKKVASPDGLNSKCKDCDREASAQYRAAHPEEAKVSSKRSKQKHTFAVKERQKNHYRKNSVQIMDQMKRFLKENPEHGLLKLARQRCKKSEVLCTISETDIVIPEFCPILGVKLEFGNMATRDNSPSLDRIIPELGYVPGNVAVISYRANRIKNEGLADEHRRIADWMDSQKVPWNKEFKGRTEVDGVVWENAGELVTA
jgi:hypothetical protein